MQIEPVLATLRAALISQAAVAVADPHHEAAVVAMSDALAPALRQAAIDLAQQAAVEVDAQLTGHRIDVVLAGPDLELRVREVEPERPDADEELDARITLRLPPSLKQTVERVATINGESVNSWVVDALSRRAHRSGATGQSMTEEFDL